GRKRSSWRRSPGTRRGSGRRFSIGPAAARPSSAPKSRSCCARYMSPEQAVGNVPDLDTRSDVYALGGTAVRAADRDDAAGGQALASDNGDEGRGILRPELDGPDVLDPGPPGLG